MSGRRTSGDPGQVWEFRFLPSFPSFPRENSSSENVWENPWKSQTSFFQTSAVFWYLATAHPRAIESRLRCLKASLVFTQDHLSHTPEETTLQKKPENTKEGPELSGRHRGIASLVFSHRGGASQRILVGAGQMGSYANGVGRILTGF